MDREGPTLRLWRQMPDEAPPEPEIPEQRIVQTFVEAEAPLSQRQIGERAAARFRTVGAVLAELVREGRVDRNSAGGAASRYRWPSPARPTTSTTRSPACAARHSLIESRSKPRTPSNGSSDRSGEEPGRCGSFRAGPPRAAFSSPSSLTKTAVTEPLPRSS